MTDAQLRLITSLLLFISAKGNDISINVYGGSEAIPGLFPSVGFIVENDGVSRCGASLIDTEWAVTAAHCFYTFKPGEPIPTRVVFGEIDIETVTSGHHESKFDLFVHPDYNEETLENDIALLHLHAAAKTTNTVEPVELATSLREHEVYNNCVVAGWGLTEMKEVSSNLKYGPVNILRSEDCVSNWPEYNENLMLCVGSSLVSACDGDAGGPLLSVDDNQKLVGIVSFGIHNCDPRVGLNRIYTRVSVYIDWIGERMRSTGSLVSFSNILYILTLGNALSEVLSFCCS